MRVRIGYVNTYSLYSLPYISCMEFKSWLAGQIEQRKMAQAELSRLSKVPQPTIQRILSGETSDPRESTMRKLRRALGFSAENELHHAPTVSLAPTIPLEEQAARLLAEMPDYLADAWFSRVKGHADTLRAEKRAAQEARQQQERDRRKHNDPPPIERRRTSP